MERNVQAIIDEIVNSLRKESDEDYCGLWQIEVQLREAGIPSSNRQDIALRIIRVILEPGDIIPGQFDAGVFHPWSTSADEAIARIRREWDCLGRMPDIGEIVWFMKP